MFIDEQLLKEQLQKLDERRNPTPFVWDCPEDDQEQENTVDIEDTDEESSGSSPLLLTGKEWKIRTSTKSWSQLPWFKLEEALEDLPKTNPFRKKKRKKIPFILSLSGAYDLGMGGTLIPLQLMLIWGIRTPLSESDLLLKAAEEKMEERRQRTERFNNAKSVLSTWLNSDQYKKTRQIRQQIKDGIPYFSSSIAMLEPFPIESIQTTRYAKAAAFAGPGDQVMKWANPVPWVDPEIREAQEFLGKEWDNDFFWDIPSRKVTIAWRSIREKSGAYPKKLIQNWNQEMTENPYADLLSEWYSEEIANAIAWAHRRQWDVLIVEKLPELRKKNPAADYELALLNYYNEDIEEEERKRRLLTLEKQERRKAYRECNAWAKAPGQESWHEEEDAYQIFPEEWRKSIHINCEAVTPALESLHQQSLEIRKNTFKSFYSTELQSWGERFAHELRDFKKQDKRFSHHTPNRFVKARRYGWRSEHLGETAEQMSSNGRKPKA
jgi:hypothetical protein